MKINNKINYYSLKAEKRMPKNEINANENNKAKAKETILKKRNKNNLFYNPF